MREERHPLAGVRQQRGGGAGPRRAFFGHDGEDIGVGLDFLEALCGELTSGLELEAPNPYLSMAIGLVRAHLDARPMTQTSLIAGAGVPYATAMRRLGEMDSAGLLERRARSRSGRSFSIHPSQKLVAAVAAMAARVRLLSCRHFGDEARVSHEHYFLGSYRTSANINPPRILPRAVSLPGGLRVLAHADPTFMVMDNLKRQFEQVIGARIQLRALSIDKLREEALRNAERKASRYDIVATDLPWIGEFAERGVLLPLDSLMDVGRLDTTDFHPMGWRAAHWAGRPYGAPSQTTPELLFYRRDLFAEAGLEPPRSTDDVLTAARYFHRPARGRYGIAWNAARGTPLGHTFIMACADFSQPVMNLRPAERGFDPDPPAVGSLRPTIDTPLGLEAAGYLRALLAYSPPDILSMGWYEGFDPMRPGASRWPIASPRSRLLSNWIRVRPPMGRRVTCPIPQCRAEGLSPRSAGMFWACPQTYRWSVVATQSRRWSPSRRAKRRSSSYSTAAGPRRAIPSEPIPRSGAYRRSSKPSTGCPGATSFNSGRARLCPRLPRSSRSAAKRCTPC
jgi:multiple sugar transport system substrate-binding protein